MTERPRPLGPGDLSPYTKPVRARSLGQMATSFGPFLLLWAVAYGLIGTHWALAALTGMAAGLFLVRIFIIQHDCGHGSFFASPAACRWVGRLCSLFTATPYGRWRTSHAQHHAQVGKLEGRGVGDIDTMTVAEYRAAGRWGRLRYRLYRHPVILFGFGPLCLFLIGNRLWSRESRSAERRSIQSTNLALLAVVGLACWALGWREYLLVQGPATMVGATIAVWLFFVQHQFENTWWARSDQWNLTEAALLGSSHYRLPRALQWLTGNIGLHHVHHLNPRVPNYHLQRCHDELPALHDAPVLTLLGSLRCLRLALWDEAQRRLVPFGAAK